LTFVLALALVAGVLTVGAFEVFLGGEAVERADFGAVVEIDKDDGSSAADADAADPAVEFGGFVGDEGFVLVMETGELDERPRLDFLGGGRGCGRFGHRLCHCCCLMLLLCFMFLSVVASLS